MHNKFLSLNQYFFSFYFAQLIPCFTRDYFLKKLDVAKFHETKVKAQILTEDGSNFLVIVTNEKGRTFFIGPTWREFAKSYRLQVGTELYMDISKPGPEIPVDLPLLPVTHPNNFSFYYLHVAYYLVINFFFLIVVNSQFVGSCN